MTTMDPTVPGCDAERPSVYGELVDGEVVYRCLCLICPRCNRHTGNGTQGHYWAFCQVAGAILRLHFCCPADCELDGAS
jgi:hypothetical protein